MSELAFLSGGGEMAQLVRTFNWTSTPLGPYENWPQSLRTAWGMVLSSRYPMFLAWGDRLTFLYNDGYAPILGTKHPAALGRPFAEVWSEIWKDIRPLVDQALDGTATWSEDLLLLMERNGYTEETYYTFSYSPVPDESGGVGGMLCACTETTQQVVSDRRLALVREIGVRMLDSRIWQETAARGMEVLAGNAREVPFALLYLAEPGSDHLTLAGVSGINANPDTAPEIMGPNNLPWKLDVAHHQREPVIVELSELGAGPWPTGLWDRPPRQAALVPVANSGSTGRGGMLIIGLNPYRPFDESYRSFLTLVAGQLSAGITRAQAYEEEKKRAEMLIEIDRAKTAFFSNVSHEFRTPLTLMLGPLEELKARFGRSTSTLEASHYQQVDSIHRNGLRLLKLVNTLLDFSRIEAGRAQAVYEGLDVAALTADLASLFRSTIEKAGLSLIVDCPSIPEPVFVDRDMWERIILNLLSNAFKFTFAGEIEVALRSSGKQIELSVRDTGIGIPEDQLGKVFERFHRVAGSQGRTYEGTGIGLSLVQELARLHGGSVSVESVSGKGSTFRVFIPQGKGHLHPQHLGGTRVATSTAFTASQFVEEAARWLQDENPAECSVLKTETLGRAKEETSSAVMHSEPVRAQASARRSQPCHTRVLLADDNADMRHYVQRLLSSQGYEVESVSDGQSAFNCAQANPPDLVVADIMMPRLDGFGLLHALRNDPATKTIPVILLSARAGEEACLEGLGAGADDYLIKPFSARELLARVESQVKMTRMRREAEAALRESEGRFRAMADTAPAMLWVTEPNGSCSFLSRWWYEFTGQTQEEGLGKQGMGWLDVTHPEDRERTSRLFRDANEQHRPFILEYRLRQHDGEYRWAIDAGRPRFGPNGEFLGYIGSVLDITERKQAEEALRVSEQQTKQARDYAEATLRSSPVPLLVLGKDLRVNTANRAFYDTFQVNAPETLGCLVYELGNGQWNIPKLRELLESILPQRTVFNAFEMTHDFTSIGRRTMLLNGRRMEDDTAQRIVLVIEDITERKQTEERLEQLTAELEQRVAERTHELAQSEDRLRALATELNLAEQRERKRLATELHDHLQQLLVLGKLTVGQGKRVAVGVPTSEQVFKKVDDIFSDALTYTRTLVSDLSPTVLRDHGLVEALRWLATYMQKHDQTVTVLVPDDANLTLPEDQVTLLFQSVRELLINSAKYAGTGEATIRMDQSDGSLRIEVYDQGAGFDLAAVASSGTSSGGISSKFGLFSIRERMRALGGSFKIESAPDQGTTATLVLPLAKNGRVDVSGGQQVVEPAPSSLSAVHSPHPTTNVSRIRVLLVDDHIMMRQGLRSVLDAYADIELVGEAGNGMEAVQIVDQLRPSVVIMDINMPKMNGIEATREIKTRYPDITVIGLSVNVDGGNQVGMLGAGAALLLTKEAAVEELYEVIMRHVGHASGLESGHPSLPFDVAEH